MTKTEVQEAVKLLADKNLVWSADFEAIREPLAELMTAVQSHKRCLGLDVAMIRALNQVAWALLDQQKETK